MDIKIIETTYELIDLIKTSEAFKLYKQLEVEIFNNPNTKSLLEEFHRKKEIFEQASQYGDYYPQLTEIKKQLQTAKINLMSDPLFKQYKENERLIERQVMEIESRFKDALNIVEKHGKKNIVL